jgi:hypothetical protein
MLRMGCAYNGDCVTARMSGKNWHLQPVVSHYLINYHSCRLFSALLIYQYVGGARKYQDKGIQRRAAARSVAALFW